MSYPEGVAPLNYSKNVFIGPERIGHQLIVWQEAGIWFYENDSLHNRRQHGCGRLDYVRCHRA